MVDGTHVGNVVLLMLFIYSFIKEWRMTDFFKKSDDERYVAKMSHTFSQNSCFDGQLLKGINKKCKSLGIRFDLVS